MKKFIVHNEDGSREVFPFEVPEKMTSPKEDAEALVLMWGRDHLRQMTDEQIFGETDLILGNCDEEHLEGVVSFLAAGMANLIVKLGEANGLTPEEALAAWDFGRWGNSG